MPISFSIIDGGGSHQAHRGTLISSLRRDHHVTRDRYYMSVRFWHSCVQPLEPSCDFGFARSSFIQTGEYYRIYLHCHPRPRAANILYVVVSLSDITRSCRSPFYMRYWPPYLLNISSMYSSSSTVNAIDQYKASFSRMLTSAPLNGWAVVNMREKLARS